MAEEGSVCELEGLETQLQSLFSRYSHDELRTDSKAFCSDFCKLVEEYASCWQVPLPQLRILEIALIYFTRASIFFTSNCDHVLHTLGSLALSIFELLLFFDQKDFHQEPLKHFTATFQECYSVLTRHQNVHLLQVERLVQSGGPWASLVLQAILSESILPQNEVEGYVSSELPVFFELRVRYLLSCERVSEAMALAKCCAQHPTTGQHLFFLQVYLTWLNKTSQHDCLHKEVADLNGKDAVHIICSLECEEENDLLLALSRAFLSQQLRRGDMYYLCDLVFIWSKLHSRLNTSKQTLLEESHQLMLSATNVNSIFPFIRVILQQLGEDGIQFCVELCASALESCLPCDIVTKSLIYKTIAGLLPNDLEMCRACALLVFFLERTFEAYKMVYLLYMHPDQEYHAEYNPIGNHIRFETLQVLKKDLYFDPEFWNLIALRTNCLKLMNEKVVSAALEEIMEDKWISNYCTKEPALRSSSTGTLHGAVKKRHHKDDRQQKEDIDMASKKPKVGQGKTQLNADHPVKKKSKKGAQPLKETSKSLRRSFWQLDRIHDNVAFAYGEHRRTTRLSEKNPPKRRIRRPKWLLEDSGTLEENNVLPKIKKHLKVDKQHQSSVVKSLESGQIKNNVRHKPSVNPHLKARENNKQQRGFSVDCLKPATPPQVILELSLPDNELMGTFTEDTCNRQRGFPQVLLYKPTVKLPATPEPVKTVRKEVVLRARDLTMFVLQMHCYAQRQKGKGKGLNSQGSVSTITRSSVQGSPPKEPQTELCEMPAAEMKGEIASQAPAPPDLQAQTTKAVSRKTSSPRELSEKSAAKIYATPESAAAEVAEAPMLDNVSEGELCEEPAVEMKVTIASQSPTVAKVTQSPGVDKGSKVPAAENVLKITASPGVSHATTADNNQMEATDDVPPFSNTANNSNAFDLVPSDSQDILLRDGDQELKLLSCNSIAEPDIPENSLNDPSGHVPCEIDTSHGGNAVTQSKVSETHTSTQNSIHDISALDVAPEGLAQNLENDKRLASENSVSKDSTAESKSGVAYNKTRSTSSWFVSEHEASTVADVQEKKGRTWNIAEIPENSESVETAPESEESKLEYCCTFCSKVFKGTLVVAHAMFHYRKDECMFCGIVFKDDLLAMIHLSDHIEKLKKSKETVSNKAQGNLVSETKDIAKPKTSAKAQTTSVSSGHCRRSGRLKKSAVCPKSVNLPVSSPSKSRKLRSNKPMGGQIVQEKQLKAFKHLNNEVALHKVNGHIGRNDELGHVGKKQQLDRAKRNSEAKQPLTQQGISQERTMNASENPELPENPDTLMDSSVLIKEEFGCSSEGKIKERESLKALKTVTKQNTKAGEKKTVQPQEKICCPVDGCAWFTDVSKNRVALLYHALEDHYGEVKPLELAFRIGNSKCSICMRVLWSFEHFLHHVERHRLSPRHPCLHQGCSARFKTGNEMRRHARRHSPLQAVCCLPGCSQLFICLWALNLHEREHYASKSNTPQKNTNVKTSDKHSNAWDEKKQQDHNSKDATATTVNAVRKLRLQTSHNLSSRKHKAPPLSTVRTSLLKERNKSKDSNVLRNLSNKDSSAQAPVRHLRLRQTLRKLISTTLNAPKTHKVISSSLLKHNSKVRHTFKKKQAKVNSKSRKRRGRPPTSDKHVHDENTTAVQSNATVKDKTALQKDQKSSSQLASSLRAAETSHVRRFKEEDKSKHVVKGTEKSVDESDSKKSVDRQIKNNRVKQKGVSPSTSTAVAAANRSNQSVTTSSAEKIKKLHKARKRSTPKETSSQTASSDANKSKKHKVTNNKAKVKKKGSLKEPKSALKKPMKSKSVVEVKAAETAVGSSDKEENAKVEKTDSTQNDPDNPVSDVPTNILNDKTAPPATSGEAIHVTKKEGKKEKTQTGCSGSGNAKAKHKDVKKERDKRTLKDKQPNKDPKTTEVQQQVEAKATLVNTPTDLSMPAVTNSLDERTSTATTDSTPQAKTEKRIKKTVTKTNDPNKANQIKQVHKKGDAKIAKKKCKVQPPTAVNTKVEESPVGEEKKPFVGALESSAGNPGYSLVMNGQANQHVKPRCTDVIATYSKRPYMRLPPTAYLDEKYITMPKRRKEISFFPCSQKSPPPEQAGVTSALQRQRCANCFATFSSAEELQSHLQLQKCSNLFGFDSDDEGNS